MHPKFYNSFLGVVGVDIKENSKMSNEEAITILKEILLSNRLTSTEQENALIIAIAELLK